MSQLIQNGDIITIGNIPKPYGKLPIGNYSVLYNEKIGFYLKIQEDFTLPPKIYGKYDFIDRWITSYYGNSEKNLGILLSGVKGSGKTISAELFCKKINLPVLFITEPFQGPEFEAFLSNPVFENCIIFIDEFEKVYGGDNKASKSLLTIMDGVYHSKLIFLLTVNSTFSIDTRLVNRLNRIKYHRQFYCLNSESSQEVINDLLKNKDHKKSVENFIDDFDFITMDILISLIKEINLFDEDAFTCASYLNLVEEFQPYSAVVQYKEFEFKISHVDLFNKATGVLQLSYEDQQRDQIEEKCEELLEIVPDYGSRTKLSDEGWSNKRVGNSFVYTHTSGVKVTLSKVIPSLLYNKKL